MTTTTTTTTKSGAAAVLPLQVAVHVVVAVEAGEAHQVAGGTAAVLPATQAAVAHVATDGTRPGLRRRSNMSKLRDVRAAGGGEGRLAQGGTASKRSSGGERGK